MLYLTTALSLRSRTPGNRIVYLYTKKTGKAPKSACGICPGRLRGVSGALYTVLSCVLGLSVILSMLIGMVFEGRSQYFWWNPEKEQC